MPARQEKPPLPCPPVSSETVFVAVAGSNEPPPLRPTTPGTNPVTLDTLKPKPILTPARSADALKSRAGYVVLCLSLHAASTRPTARENADKTTRFICYFPQMQ